MGVFFIKGIKMPKNTLNVSRETNPKKRLIIATVIAFFIVIAVFTVYSQRTNDTLVNQLNDSTAIAAYDLQLKNNQYMYSQPVNFSGVPLTISQLKDLSTLTTLAPSKVRALVAYLIHRFTFADQDEKRAIKHLVTQPYFKSNDSVDFLKCRVSGDCDFNALIAQFPLSPWKNYWILLGDITRINDVQTQLNTLQTSALDVVTYFDNEKRPIPAVVPPALAESLVIIPFMENCTLRQQDLMLYLYEVKVQFPPMLDLVDYYIEQAKNGECE